MTIGQYIGRENHPTKGYASKRGVEEKVPLPNWLVGIELEIEDWNDNHDRECPGFNFTSDGSLRNNGIEAVTLPVAIKQVRGLLNYFFGRFEITDGNYSERCSTHVHFNVEPLEWHQLASLCLLYQTVETLLFKFTQGDRENNIFCVPWNQCNQSYNVVANFQAQGPSIFRSWQKYSALNLATISEHGTVEFRHLGGTCDVDKIMTWISLLAKMFEYVLAHPYEEIKQSVLHMNTISNYREWLEQIFGTYMEHIQYPGYEKDLAKGVIDSKLQIVSEKGPITAHTPWINPEAELIWNTAGDVVTMAGVHVFDSPAIPVEPPTPRPVARPRIRPRGVVIPPPVMSTQEREQLMARYITQLERMGVAPPPGTIADEPQF